MSSQHLLLILIEVFVQTLIAAPTTIKILLHLQHLLLKLIKELHIFPAGLSEGVYISIYLLQFLEVSVTHETVKRTYFLEELDAIESWEERERFLDIIDRPYKEFELLRVEEIRAADQLLEEHIQKEAPLLDEFLVQVVHLLFLRYLRNIESSKPLHQRHPQKIKLLVPPHNLIFTISIYADHGVHDEVSSCGFLRRANRKVLGEFVGGEGVIDYELGFVSIQIVPLILLHQNVANHMIFLQHARIVSLTRTR